jgi:hypothetical protein
MRRRNFIALLGGAARGRSGRARGQGERMRRVDVLVSSADRDLKARAGFRQGLEKLGGRRIETSASTLASL